MYFQAECFDPDCRATGSTFIVSMSQPGAVIGGFVLTRFVSANGDLSIAAAVIAFGGVFVAGLAMLAARKVDTDLTSLTEEVSEPAPAPAMD